MPRSIHPCPAGYASLNTHLSYGLCLAQYTPVLRAVPRSIHTCPAGCASINTHLSCRPCLAQCTPVLQAVPRSIHTCPVGYASLNTHLSLWLCLAPALPNHGLHNSIYETHTHANTRMHMLTGAHFRQVQSWLGLSTLTNKQQGQGTLPGCTVRARIRACLPIAKMRECACANHATADVYQHGQPVLHECVCVCVPICVHLLACGRVCVRICAHVRVCAHVNASACANHAPVAVPVIQLGTSQRQPALLQDYWAPLQLHALYGHPPRTLWVLGRCRPSRRAALCRLRCPPAPVSARHRVKGSILPPSLPTSTCVRKA